MRTRSRVNGSRAAVIVKAIALVTLFAVALTPAASGQAPAERPTITNPDSAGEVGTQNSLQLDDQDFPVISYFDRDQERLRLMHCNDVACAGGDESIVELDTDYQAGRRSSLALDADGYPVVSYFAGEFYDFDNEARSEELRLARCNDPNCVGGDESIVVAAPVTGGFAWSDLELDTNGYPVVSFVTRNGVQLLRCNDMYCAGGDDPVATISAEAEGLTDTSMVLDGDSNPVIVYRVGFMFTITHCGDPNCTPDQMVTNQVPIPADSGEGIHRRFALQLDASGNPVAAFYDNNETLHVLHCNDPYCAGDDDVPVSAGRGWGAISMSLDQDGFPVIAVSDWGQSGLQILHCADVGCQSPSASLVALGTMELEDRYRGSSSELGFASLHTSMQLDSGGNPVASIYNGTFHDLNVARCVDPSCSAPTPTCFGLTATVDLTAGETGTDANDVIIGTDGPDTILSGGGDDFVCGRGGDDVIAAGTGADVVAGGSGDDRIWGQAGKDRTYGEAGNDHMSGGGGNDQVLGGTGSDTISGSSGDDFVDGGYGDDQAVRGGSGDDTVYGGDGNDLLVAGNGGEDTVDAGDGNDSKVTGGPRPDQIFGGGGNDVLRGNKGADVLVGGPGSDEIFGGPQADSMIGGDVVLDCGSGTTAARCLNSSTARAVLQDDDYDICNGGTTGDGILEFDTAIDCDETPNVP